MAVTIADLLEEFPELRRPGRLAKLRRGLCHWADETADVNPELREVAHEPEMLRIYYLVQLGHKASEPAA